jgi:hypothetical protein
MGSKMCRHYCDKFNLDGIDRNGSESIYGAGFKRCITCMKFVKPEDTHRCPCCNGLLRSSPRKGPRRSSPVSSNQRKDCQRIRIE